MTIDHKQRFQNGPHAKDWGRIVMTEPYIEAMSASLLVMLAQQGTDALSAARMEGARHVLGILTNLTTQKNSPTPIDQNLKTNV